MPVIEAWPELETVFSASLRLRVKKEKSLA
jgi:hypothetical protein